MDGQTDQECYRKSSLDIEIDKLEMENITKLLNINMHLYLLNHDR